MPKSTFMNCFSRSLQVGCAACCPTNRRSPSRRLRSVIHLAGTGDVVLVVFARAGQTNSATTLDLFLPTSEDRQAILRGNGGVMGRPELATQ